MYKLFPAILVLGGYFSVAQLVYAQGCGPPDGPPCSPNPIPCAHCNGTWTDSEGKVYEVSTEPNHSVSGTATSWDEQGGCPFTYDISGTIDQNPPGKPLGTTELHWTMTDHDQTCGEQYSVSFTFDGTMANSGCNSASGTLTNTEGPPYSNPDLTMTKPPDDPDGSPTETTAAIAWWGAAPTVLQFQGTIQASTSFAGRQVFEAPNFEPTDTCWFSGLLESQRFHITGGGWFVGYYYFDNRWHYDYVGMGPGLIDIYRNNNRIPCSAAAGQNMHLYTYGTSFSLFYKNNVLQVSLPDDFRIRVARDGPVDPCVLPTCAERAWGIQTEYLPFAVQGIPYTISGQPVQLTAALQTTPYNWVKIEGSLPAGLTLLSSGVISGTPLAGGLSAFRVQVTDSNGFWATRFFILIVLPAKVPGQLVSD